jgi:hypothetical protein
MPNQDSLRVQVSMSALNLVPAARTTTRARSAASEAFWREGETAPQRRDIPYGYFLILVHAIQSTDRESQVLLLICYQFNIGTSLRKSIRPTLIKIYIYRNQHYLN